VTPAFAVSLNVVSQPQKPFAQAVRPGLTTPDVPRFQAYSAARSRRHSRNRSRAASFGVAAAVAGVLLVASFEAWRGIAFQPIAAASESVDAGTGAAATGTSVLPGTIRANGRLP